MIIESFNLQNKSLLGYMHVDKDSAEVLKCRNLVFNQKHKKRKARTYIDISIAPHTCHKKEQKKRKWSNKNKNAFGKKLL